MQQAVAKTYRVDPSAVRIVPLFVNRLGDWLGVAVWIGKGAVLILPEFPDKAAVVKRLVTDLWGAVQEWLRGGSATSAKVSKEQARVDPAGTPRSPEGTKQDGVDEMAELEKSIPSLDRKSGEWVSNTEAAEIEGVKTETLKRYRTDGMRNADASLGRDADGRVWRRSGTKSAHPWYLKSSLRNKDKRGA